MRQTLSPSGSSRPETIPVVRLEGPIAAGSRLGRSLSLASVAGLLEAAFEIKAAPAVALVINSPGGSPAQSALIHRRIRSLSEERGKPVFAFVEDVAASGGYMIACAADEIFADTTSIVGSIGVISLRFGYHSLMEKLGIEARVNTAGMNKFRLSPFKPEDPGDVAWLNDQLRDMHRIFIDIVAARRTDAINRGTKAEDVYSGAYWLGEQARDLGLIDGIGDLRGVLKSRFGSKTRFRLIARRRSWWEAMGPLSRRRTGSEAAGAGLEGGGFGGGLVDPDALIDALERRGHWGRFGL